MTSLAHTLSHNTLNAIVKHFQLTEQGDPHMTLTSPMCPVAEILPPEVEAKVRAVTGVQDVDLEVVWDPPWSPDMMSEAAKLELNYF